MTFSINPAKPVSFNLAAITKCFNEVGSLMAQVKYDSVRCHLIIKRDENNQVTMQALSRTDKPLPALVNLIDNFDTDKLDTFMNECLYQDGIVFDGEIMVKDVDFNTGSGMIRRKAPIEASKLTYMLYGVLPLAHFTDNAKNVTFPISACVMNEQLTVCMHQLRELLPQLDWQQALTYEVYDIEGLETIYETVRDAGHEGLVIKNPLGHWHRGKKVGWWKCKASDTQDGTVCGILWGTEGKANEGKVIGFEVLLENGVVVNVTGITQAQMAEFTINPEMYLGWYVEVGYMEETPEGSLRHPHFIKWRGTETHPTLKS